MNLLTYFLATMCLILSTMAASTNITLHTTLTIPVTFTIPAVSTPTAIVNPNLPNQVQALLNRSTTPCYSVPQGHVCCEKGLQNPINPNEAMNLMHKVCSTVVGSRPVPAKCPAISGKSENEKLEYTVMYHGEEIIGRLGYDKCMSGLLPILWKCPELGAVGMGGVYWTDEWFWKLGVVEEKVGSGKDEI